MRNWGIKNNLQEHFNLVKLKLFLYYVFFFGFCFLKAYITLIFRIRSDQKWQKKCSINMNRKGWGWKLPASKKKSLLNTINKMTFFSLKLQQILNCKGIVKHYFTWNYFWSKNTPAMSMYEEDNICVVHVYYSQFSQQTTVLLNICITYWPQLL